MFEAYALYTWYEDGEGKELVAVFVSTPSVPDPHGRAHEVMRRMSMDGTRGDQFSVEKMDINLDNKALGLKPLLGEFETGDFVDAAYRELLEHGSVQLPLWASPEWFRHEIRARYNEPIELVGRRINRVARTERTRESDAGFVETQ
jgi:hypothetical protein